MLEAKSFKSRQHQVTQSLPKELQLSSFISKSGTSTAHSTACRSTPRTLDYSSTGAQQPQDSHSKIRKIQARAHNNDRLKQGVNHSKDGPPVDFYFNDTFRLRHSKKLIDSFFAISKDLDKVSDQKLSQNNHNGLDQSQQVQKISKPIYLKPDAINARNLNSRKKESLNIPISCQTLNLRELQQPFNEEQSNQQNAGNRFVRSSRAQSPFKIQDLAKQFHLQSDSHSKLQYSLQQSLKFESIDEWEGTETKPSTSLSNRKKPHTRTKGRRPSTTQNLKSSSKPNTKLRDSFFSSGISDSKSLWYDSEAFPERENALNRGNFSSDPTTPSLKNQAIRHGYYTESVVSDGKVKFEGLGIPQCKQYIVRCYKDLPHLPTNNPLLYREEKLDKRQFPRLWKPADTQQGPSQQSVSLSQRSYFPASSSSDTARTFLFPNVQSLKQVICRQSSYGENTRTTEQEVHILPSKYYRLELLSQQNEELRDIIRSICTMILEGQGRVLTCAISLENVHKLDEKQFFFKNLGTAGIVEEFCVRGRYIRNLIKPHLFIDEQWTVRPETLSPEVIAETLKLGSSDSQDSLFDWVKNDPELVTASEVWSLGCLLIELLTLIPLNSIYRCKVSAGHQTHVFRRGLLCQKKSDAAFSFERLQQKQKKLKSHIERVFREELKEQKICPQLLGVIVKMVSYDPHERPSPHQILNCL